VLVRIRASQAVQLGRPVQIAVIPRRRRPGSPARPGLAAPGYDDANPRNGDRDEWRGQGRPPGAAGVHGPARPGPHRGL